MSFKVPPTLDRSHLREPFSTKMTELNTEPRLNVSHSLATLISHLAPMKIVAPKKLVPKYPEAIEFLNQLYGKHLDPESCIKALIQKLEIMPEDLDSLSYKSEDSMQSFILMLKVVQLFHEQKDSPNLQSNVKSLIQHCIDKNYIKTAAAFISRLNLLKENDSLFLAALVNVSPHFAKQILQEYLRTSLFFPLEIELDYNTSPQEAVASGKLIHSFYL